MTKELKFHSNFIKSIGRFDSSRFNSNNGRTNSKRSTATNSTKVERNPKCELCRYKVSSFISFNAEIEAMIRKSSDIEQRLKDIEEKYKSLQDSEARARAENNEFRLIGLLEDVKTPNGIITENLLAASHLHSVDQLDVETRILFVNRLQKHLEFFTVSLQKSRNKVEIKTDIAAARAKEVLKSQEMISKDERENRRRTVYKDFHKMVTGIMKSSRCDEKTALAMVKNMGILIPVDY